MSDLVPTGLSPGQYAARLVVLKALEKRIKDLTAATQRAARNAFLPGDRKGAEHDGVRIGSVSYAKGRGGGFVVTDPKAFLAWCEANHPSAIVVTREVRSSDQEALLAGIAKGGPVPAGVEEVDPGAPYFIVTPDVEAVAQIDWQAYLAVPTKEIDHDHRQ